MNNEQRVPTDDEVNNAIKEAAETVLGHKISHIEYTLESRTPNQTCMWYTHKNGMKYELCEALHLSQINSILRRSRATLNYTMNNEPTSFPVLLNADRNNVVGSVTLTEECIELLNRLRTEGKESLQDEPFRIGVEFILKDGFHLQSFNIHFTPSTKETNG